MAFTYNFTEKFCSSNDSPGLVLFLVFDCCLLFLITIDVNTRCNAHTKLNFLLLLLLSYYGTCFYDSELCKRIPNPSQSVAVREVVSVQEKGSWEEPHDPNGLYSGHGDFSL